MRLHALVLAAFAAFLTADLAGAQSFIHVDGSNGSLTRYASQAEAAAQYDCARGDLVFEETLRFDAQRRTVSASYRQLTATVTLAQNPPDPGGDVIAADFHSTVDAACPGALFRSQREPAGPVGWRCDALVSAATRKAGAQ